MLSPYVIFVLYIIMGFHAALSVLLAVFLRSKLITKIAIGLSFIFSLVIVGLRDRWVGVDTNKFLVWTESIRSISGISNFGDPVYYGIGFLSIKIFGTSQSVFFVIGTFTLLLIFYSYNKFIEGFQNGTHPEYSSRYYVMYTFCIFFLFSQSTFSFLVINQTRQALAIAFLLCSTAFLFSASKINLKIIILMTLASLSHLSALFIFPLILISKQLESCKWPFVALLVSLVLGQIGFIEALFNFVGIDYLIRKISSVSYNNTSTLNQLKVFVSFLSSIYFWYISRYKKDKMFIYLTNIFILITSVALFFVGEYGEAANRILRYSTLFIPALLAMSIYFYRKDSLMLLGHFFVSGCYMLFVILFPSFSENIGCCIANG